MAAWSRGMYCLNVIHLLLSHSSAYLAFAQGNKGTNGEDANEAAFPLYKLPKSEWWSEFIKLIVAIDN
jgi:hypothetical protein